MEDLKRKQDEWEKKSAEGPTDLRTDSGIPIKRLYMPTDRAQTEADYLAKLGFPGEPPFTRGINPFGYRKNVWTMLQYAGRASAKDMNRFLKQQLAHGVSGLDVAVDLPTQVGLDSDHPLAQGEVGKVGVPINSLRDMEEIFEGIDVSKVHVTIQTNAQPFYTLALLIALAERQGGDVRNLSSFFQNDILKEFIARGTYIYPPAPSMRLTTDVILYCAKHQPKISPQMVCEYHMRDAGCSIIQSSAMMLGNAIAYADWIRKRGGSLEDYLKNLYVFITANHADFFEEVARIRAVRRMWCQLWKDRYGVTDPGLLQCRFIEFQTGGPLTAVEPENNITRTAISILAGALSGIQVMGPRTFDEALGIPSDKSLKLSLRAQQIVAYETGVTKTIDPLAGSYYVEWLTDEVEKRIWDYLAVIEKHGGMVEAIASGWVHSEIATAAYRHQKEIERGERIIVGVNKFVADAEAEVETYVPRSEDQKRALESLQKVRQERNSRKVKEALEKLRKVAATEENIIPATVEAVRNYATVGEICGTLKEVLGEFRVRI